MKILYVRSGPYELSFNSYNLQEVGLAKALCKKGYDVDILYYSKENYDQELTYSGKTIRILWRHGIKLLRSGVYPCILKKSFLKQYDYIIASEYSQIMSILLIFLNKNTFIYNGPYYNLFKIPFFEKIYDKLFCSYINKNAQKVFCKTKIAEQFLYQKGIMNTKVIGVGLDNEKIDKTNLISKHTLDIVHKLEEHTNLLFVGSITPRKNVAFLFKMYNILKHKYVDSNLQLVIIGKGTTKYLDYCFSQLDDIVRDSVLYIDFIDNSQLKYIYEKSDIFLLASTEEIFGMVLLEAMYNNLIPISSYNAGSNTLIKNNYNGFIINKFDSNEWINCIEKIILDDNRKKILGENAYKTICESFLWDKIVDKIISEF